MLRCYPSLDSSSRVVAAVEPVGILLVIAGPSGVGKGTIGKLLLSREPGLAWSVSATTRPPRPGEVEGDDYFFMGRDEFDAMREAGGFIESFEVYGQSKGTPKAAVLERLASGGDILLEVDVQGALAVRTSIPEAVLVFLRAPSPDAQRERLVGRGADDDEQIDRRLATAAEEEALMDHFDEVVINDDPERAAQAVAAILMARRMQDGAL